MKKDIILWATVDIWTLQMIKVGFMDQGKEIDFLLHQLR